MTWFTRFKTEKNLLWLLIGILIITTAIDAFTAFRLPIFEIAEINPIYLLTGNVMPLIIINIFVVFWMARNLKNGISIGKIFFFVILTLYLSVGHGFGIWSNLSAGEEYEQDPEGFIEYAQAITPKERAQAYGILVGIVMVLPIVISIIAFNIAMFFFGKRQPIRDRIIQEMLELAERLRRK